MADKDKDRRTAAPAREQLAEREPAQPASMAGGAVATQARTASSLALYDEADIGAGLKDLTQDDLQIPFLAILQKGNPQVEEDNPRYIKGAKPGGFFNTVTSQVFDGKVGIRIIPVHRVHNFIEWIPRDDGGGLVAVHEPESEAVRGALAKAGKRFGRGIKINDNNDLVETFNVYALQVLDDDTFDRVVLGFSSSQIGRYKRLMTRANSIQLKSDHGMVTPPLFSHVYRARTEFVQKQENTWYKWLLDFDGANAEACRLTRDNPLYLAAKDFRTMVMSGAATAAYEGAQQEGAADAGEAYSM